jgi:hypothetical protein
MSGSTIKFIRKGRSYARELQRDRKWEGNDIATPERRTGCGFDESKRQEVYGGALTTFGMKEGDR